MTIRYDGNRQTMTKSRMAVISINSNEETLAERTIDFLKRVKGWNGFDWFDNCVVIDMRDKDEYNEFVADYKEAKKMIKDCMKFGF